MRKIKEILRLKFEHGLSDRKIARACGISRATVKEYLDRFTRVGLSWPLPEDSNDAWLEGRLFSPQPLCLASQRPLPDFPQIQAELKRRKGVTLQLLWEEYKEKYPGGYQYSRFCYLYNRWASKLDLVMRQEHRAGEKMFVDYAGQTVPIINPETGEITEAQIFVAVLGASSYTFAEATLTQTLPDWVGSHVRALEFFGGVPEAIVPDNLRSAVKNACFYEPDLNPTYQDLASHYGAVVLPARVRRPRDKAKAEAAVLLVERWILARLRNHRFFSLTELNREIARLLAQLNARPFKKLAGSRATLFASVERPALNPLPALAYEYAEWKKATVHIDYHVEIGRHYYSVPHQLAGKKLDIRCTANTIECFLQGNRVASHKRNNLAGRHTTVPEHMPPNHQQYLKWNPERFRRWADGIGPNTVKVTETVFASRVHPQQAYRTLLGILRLAKGHGKERLEAACGRALAIGSATSFRSIEAILKNGLDRQPLPENPIQPPVAHHQNIRGGAYFAQTGKQGDRPC